MMTKGALYSIFRAVVVSILLSAAVCTGAPASPVSSAIPLDNWLYPALEKLSGLGYVQSGLQANRPFTRLEAARQTLEAERNSRGRSVPPLVTELLERLRDELKTQIIELDGGAGRHPGSYFKPVGEYDIRYVRSKGLYSTIPDGRIESSQFLLNANNYGIDYDDKNGQFTFETEARLGHRLLINVRPIVLYRENDADGQTESDTSLLTGVFAFGLGKTELSIGRQALWWGQGRHGALSLTNNARPLDMVRWTNPSPVLLPWLFRGLGPFRFDFFVAQLEKQRVVAEPYLTGVHLNFKPVPWLEIGARRTIIFGGEGVPSFGVTDYLRMMVGDHPKPDNSNSIAVFDFRINIPFPVRADLYGEIGAEDLSNPPFGLADEAWLIGLYLPQLDPGARTSLRFEFTDLVEQDDHINRWYVHRFYRSGYTYERKILGHFAGTDARDYYAEFNLMLPDDILLTASYTYQPRGVSEPVQEEHRQQALQLAWNFTPEIGILLSYARDEVDNFDFVTGDNRDFSLVRTAIRGSW